jgi:hypothetical protein
MAAVLWLGFGLTAQAQLLYEWAFTNSTDTATSSVPTFVATPGTGNLGLRNVDGTTAISSGLIYFTNANSGPPGGPGGALVMNGQGYNGTGSDGIATNSTLNLGTLYQFTVTFWVQYGAADAIGTQLSRQVQFGASANYDEGGKGAGNINGVGSGVNGANIPAGSYGQFQDGIASSGGANAQVTITGDPNFANGFVCDGQTWYFEAITYNGLITTTNFTVWLASTNAVTVSGTPGIDSFVQSQNLGGIPFTTNASVILDGCAGAGRDITTGQIGDVRIYSGVLTSNQLITVRNFGYPTVANPPASASIISQPNSGNTFTGGNRTFSVAAVGSPAVFTYLWRSNNVPIAGATNSSFTLSNATASANGASFVCSVTNVVGGTNSIAGVITVVAPTPHSYAQTVFTNKPYALWLFNEPSNSPTVPIFDYANGNDAVATRPAGDLFQQPGPSSPFYSGFSTTNTSIEAPASGGNGPLNAPALPVYTNAGMTICGWIYTPSAGNGGVNANGLIYSLPSDTLPGFGLTFGSGNELDYQWGSTAVTGSGLIIPSAEWTFVALVVSTNLVQYDLDNLIAADTNATLYIGSQSGGGISQYIDDTAQTGHLIPNGVSPAILAFGRTTQSSAENGGHNDQSNVRFSDVSVFYQALSAQTITNLYMIGATTSLPISIGRDPGTPGNVLINWTIGTLQEATVVSGPYTDVAGPPSPPYSVPATDAHHFYRLRN